MIFLLSLLQVYEITGESICQFFLQSAILLFELIHYEEHEEIITLPNSKLALASIATSIVSIFFGLSSIWMGKVDRDASIEKKMRFITCNMADVIMRLMLVLSILLLSFRWRYGMIIWLSIVCLLVLLLPNILSRLYFVICKGNLQFMDRSLMVCPMFWHDFQSENESPFQVSPEEKKLCQKSRIRNKFCGIMASLAGMMFILLACYDVIPLPLQDAW